MQSTIFRSASGLVFAVLAASAVAQESRTLPTIRVEDSADQEVGYVALEGVGATRTSTPLIETPQSISVITLEQIRDLNASNMQEVLRYSAGVRAEMYGLDNRGDWFTLRGGSEGSVLLDGLRLPLSGWYGNVRNEPFAFERIEVLRGPSSVIAGQNGPGGVVNLVSKRPQADAAREIMLQAGSYDHKQVALDFTGPLNAAGSLLYRLVALGMDSGTQVDHADEERQYFAPSMTWLPGEATSLTVFAEYQNDESNNNVGFFPWQGMILPAPNGRIPVDTFIGEPQWDTYGGERMRIGYQFERELSGNWSLRHDLRYDDIDGEMRGMYANFWENDFGLLPDGRSVNRTWYATRTQTNVTNAAVQLEGHLTFGPAEHTVLVAMDGLWSRDVNPNLGGEGTPLDVYAPAYGTFPLPDLDFGPEIPTRARQIGLSLQDQVKLNDRWVFVGSLRGDRAKTQVKGSPDAGSDEDAWTTRVGVVYLADGGWAPYASYSESFELVTGVDFYGSPFKPKRGEQMEVGVKWSAAAGNLTAAVAAYELKEKNRLSADPENPLNQVQRGEVTVRGAELDLSAHVAAWDLIGNYTYTDAEVSASSEADDPYVGKQLTSIPENSASLWAVYNFDLAGIAGFRAGAGIRYVDETWDGLDRLSVPSYTLVDALLSLDLGSWRYALNASNLTDKIYFATCLERGDCWYGLRREIAASATYRF